MFYWIVISFTQWLLRINGFYLFVTKHLYKGRIAELFEWQERVNLFTNGAQWMEVEIKTKININIYKYNKILNDEQIPNSEWIMNSHRTIISHRAMKSDFGDVVSRKRQKKMHTCWIKKKICFDKKPKNDHHKGFARGHPPYY